MLSQVGQQSCRVHLHRLQRFYCELTLLRRTWVAQATRDGSPPLVHELLCCISCICLCFYDKVKFEIRDVGVLTPGFMDRRVNCRCVPQSRWVGARWNTKGGNHGFVLSCARVGALAVGVTNVREGEREPRATTLPYEGPGPSFYRCKERVQVYNGGVAIC
jgi:hypothetical protein